MRLPFLRSAMRLAVIGTCALIQGACSQSNARDPMAEILAARKPQSERPPVVGDLGGVPVTIPAAYVRLLEYDGDPNWFDPERAKWKAPQRTHESKISSFGVLVHYPDMQPLTRANFESYPNKTIYDYDWMNIGVSSASSFVPTNLENPYGHWIPGKEPQASYAYEQQEGLVHGLVAYKAIRDLATHQVFDDNKAQYSNHVRYLGYESGKVMTVIECAAGMPPVRGGVMSCKHRFVLLPGMRAELSLRYPRAFLPHWRTYQERARDLLLSFRVAPDTKVKTN